MIKKYLRLLLVVAFLIVGAAACAPIEKAVPTEKASAEKPVPTEKASAEKPAEKPVLPPAVDKDTIVIAAIGVPNTLDPEHDVSDQFGVASVHATLVEYKYIQKPDGSYTIDISYGVQPMLAERWDVSDDELQYTFYLRKGVKSCYGNEISTDDVLFTWERHIAINAMGMVNSNLWNLKNINQIKKIDDLSFRITIPEPRPFVLSDLAIGHLSILDSKEVKKHITSDDPWAEKWVNNHDSGYGAYCVKELTAGQQLVLTPNPYWYEGSLPNKVVIYKAIPENTTRLQLLTSGDVDIALGLNPSQLEEARKNPQLKVIETDPSNLSLFLMWNNGMEPFNNVKVRQALSYAIPYEDIINTVFYGHATQGIGPYTPLNPEYDPEAHKSVTDLDKAKKLLAEAGYPNGFSTQIFCESNKQQTIDAAVLVASSFKKIGVDVTVEKLSPAVYGERQSNKTLPIGMWHDYVIVETAAFSTPLFWGDPDFILNIANYGKDGYDGFPYMETMHKALLSIDPKEQKALWKDLQRNIIDRAGAGFILYTPYQIAMNRQVEGFHWHPDNHVRARFLYWGK